MKITGIIQARLKSDLDRLILNRIDEITFFEVVIKRLKMCHSIHELILSTDNDNSNIPLRELAEKEDITIYIGNNDDLLGRIINTADKSKADVIVRVGGNTPLIDPFLTNSLIEQHVKNDSDFTYASGFPLGIVYDVVNLKALKQIHRSNFRVRYQNLFLETPNSFHINTLKSTLDLSEINLVIENRYNFKIFNQIFLKYPLLDFTYQDILDLLPVILLTIIEGNISLKEKKYYNKLLNIFERKNQLPEQMSHPLLLRMDFNNLCNIKCRTCPQSERGKFSPVNTVEAARVDRIRKDEKGIYINKSYPFSLTMYKDLQDPLFLFLENICFGWLGEPFLYKDLDFILKINNAFAIKTGFITNGILLDSPIAKILIDNEVESINFSIDSVTPEKFRKIRNGAELEHLVENIHMLNKLKKISGKNTPHLYFSFTMGSDNISDLPELILFARKMGITTIHTQYRFIMNFMNPKESLFFYPGKVKEYFLQAQEIALQNDIILNLPGSNTFQEGECTLPWTQVFISSKGEVTPCCAILRPFGNLSSQIFSDIWRSKSYNSFRYNLKKSFNLPYECVNCGIQGNPDNIRNFMEEGHCKNI